MAWRDEFDAVKAAWLDGKEDLFNQAAASNQAAIDRLTKEVAETNAELAEVKDACAALTVERDAARAETAKVQAAFDAYRATHPDPKPRMLVGAWSQRQAGETLPQAFARFEAACGPAQVKRVYDSGQGPARVLADARLAGLGKCAIVASFKAPPADVAAGKYDKAILDAATAFVAESNGFPIYLCWAHECDSKVQNGEYTADAFRAGWQRFSDVVKDTGVQRTLILTGYQFGQRISNFYVPGTVDVVAVDPYSHTASDTADVLVKNFGMLDWFTANKVRWGVAEIGQTDKTDAARAALVRSYAKLADMGAEFVCHFNSADSQNDYRIDDKPAVAPEFQNLKRA